MNLEEAFAQNAFNTMLKAMPFRLQQKEDEFGRKLANSRLNTIGKLKVLYDFMDEFFGHVSDFTPCKKWCSYCCHYEVCVSEQEVKYIEKNTKYKRLKRPKVVIGGHGKPCPFLKNGACSIYDERPFVCRKHVVFRKSNVACHPDVCFQNQSIQLRLSGLEEAYASIIGNGGYPKLYDIRQVFEA